MLPECVVTFAKQATGPFVAAEAVLGGQTLEPLPDYIIAHKRDERLWIVADLERDDLGVVVVLERPVQGALVVGIRDAQNAWSRQRLDLRESRLGAEVFEQLLFLFWIWSVFIVLREWRVCVGVGQFACRSFEGLQHH